MNDLTELAEAVGVLEPQEPPLTTKDVVGALVATVAAYPILVGVMLL